MTNFVIIRVVSGFDARTFLLEDWNLKIPEFEKRC